MLSLLVLLSVMSSSDLLTLKKIQENRWALDSLRAIPTLSSNPSILGFKALGTLLVFTPR